MNLRIITKNHAADPEIGFITKSISKPYGRALAIPTAWEISKSDVVFKVRSKILNFDSDSKDIAFKSIFLITGHL